MELQQSNTSEDCSCEVAAESFNVSHFIFYGLISTALIVSGLVGNLASAIVLNMKSFRSYHNLQLSVMLLWHSALLILFFLHFTVWVFKDETGTVRHYGPRVKYLFYNHIAINTGFAGSIWSVVIVTFQRYLAVTQPYLHNTSTGVKIFKWSMIVSFALPIAANLHRGFEISIGSCCLKGDGKMSEKVSVLLFTDKGDTFYLLVRVGVDLILLYVVPLGSIITLTVLMFKSLKNANDNRRKMSRNQQIGSQDTCINRILSHIVFSFIVCFSLPSLLNLLELVIPTGLYQSDVIEQLKTLGHVMVMFNCASNFPIFYCNGSTFRTETNRIWRHFSRRYSAVAQPQSIVPLVTLSNQPCRVERDMVVTPLFRRRISLESQVRRVSPHVIDVTYEFHSEESPSPSSVYPASTAGEISPSLL